MHKIIKQPDGFYSVWSTIVDNFVMENVTPEEIIENRLENQKLIVENLVWEEIKNINRGKKFMTFNEAIRFRNEVHKGD